MGGIQSISSLPGDSTFNAKDNHYDIPSYKKICAEFGIDPTIDFRFTGRKNHGLGDVYVGVTGGGPMKTGQAYPGGFYKFGDEGGKAKEGNLLDYIELDAVAYSQYDWFAPNTAAGLTKAGLSRVNQSIEAFVYCVLGAQVALRSSILGEGGRAKEVQTEFLAKFEESVHQPDLSKSVQRYQLALDQAKVRLNFAVCPGAWLMPARMIINTDSVVGYNNMLKQAVPGMKLGVNNGVNQGTKKAGLQYMEGGRSKINPPNPSNPMQASAQAPRTPKSSPFNLPSDEVGQIEEEMKDETPQHDINKAAVIIGVVGVAALLIIATRQRRLLMYVSKIKTTTAKIRSQVCSARKPRTCPAVLKRKLTIAPMTPGNAEAAFAPSALRPFAIFLPMAFKALVIAPMTAPIVTPAARKIAVTVTPYFLKISLTFSNNSLAFSERGLFSLSCSSIRLISL